MSDVKRFYIMTGAVQALLSEQPTYTPMTNHQTDVHTVPVVLASDFDALQQRCVELERTTAFREKCKMENFIHAQNKLIDCEREGYKRLQSERDALRAEVERLRKALRSAITAAGGATAPEVSTEFLEQAALEVLAMRGKHEQMIKRLLNVVTHPHESKEALANRVRQILEARL